MIYPSDTTTRSYATLYRQLRQSGRSLPTNALWIASLVVEHGLVLYSRDAHFRRLPHAIVAFVQGGITGGVAAVAIVWLFAACEVSCAVGDGDRARVEKSIADELAAKDVTVTVECSQPSSEPFTCEALTSSGRAIMLEVRREGSTYNWQSRDVAIGAVLVGRIRDNALNQLGLQLDELSCPPVIWADKPAECASIAEEVEIPFRVDLVEDSFEPTTGVVVGASAASAIADLAEAQLGARPEVDCGFNLRPSKPGTTFTCDLSLPDGGQQTMWVTIADSAGNVSFSSDPP